MTHFYIVALFIVFKRNKEMSVYLLKPVMFFLSIKGNKIVINSGEKKVD